MARFKNRSTAVHETITSEFRSKLKDLKKSNVPAFGTESNNPKTDPIQEAIKASGIKMRPERGRRV